MQDESLRRALLKVPNITHFCEKHELSPRTVFRAKVKGVSLSSAIRKLLRLALVEEGHLASGDTSTKTRRPAAKRSGVVGRRDKKKQA
jgi:hypothetical protein